MLIVGVSARAAVHSALRGGLAPTAIDAFADADLRAGCHAVPLERFPEGLEAASRPLEAQEWMYCGALENRPELVESLSMRIRLLGNDADTLRRVRDPLAVAATLHVAGVPCPRSTRAPPPRDQQEWLMKPLASGGGRNLHRWPSPAAREAKANGQAWYWQARVDGRPYAATYLANGKQCILLGLTRQLLGPQWGAATRYEYCGSIGPLKVSPAARGILCRVGDSLTSAFGLRGLFGVDLVRNAEGFWPVEVNPRYTASMELFDWAWGVSLVAWHRSACRGRLSAAPRPAPGCFGKLFVFADRNLSAPEGLWRDLSQHRVGPEWAAFADVPVDGAAIPAGGPIATVFARADTLPALRQALRDRASWLRGRLGLR